MPVYMVTVLQPIPVFYDYLADVAVYYDEMVCELVQATSRGQARALFTNKHDLEFITPLHIQKIADTEGTSEVLAVAYDHEYWKKVNWDKIPKTKETPCRSILLQIFDV